MSPVCTGRAHQDGWGTMLLFFPQIASALCGTIIGEWLRQSSAPSEKIKRILVASVLCLTSGGVVSLFMPAIMKLWTPSYILLNIGISGVLLAFFYWQPFWQMPRKLYHQCLILTVLLTGEVQRKSTRRSILDQ